jgi:two-component system sensor histidine kinase BarA
MKNLGIKYQILLITLIPVFLIDLFFTYTHINNSIEQASELLQSKSQIIARQIAGASEFNLFAGNDSQIQYLLAQSIDTNSIVQASVYDHQGKLIAESRSPTFQQSSATDYFYTRQPILSQSIEPSAAIALEAHETHHAKGLGWVHLYISRQQLQLTIRGIIIDSIVFFVSMLLMAIMLTVVISRRITQPIFRLIEHLKYVETGELGKTIKITEANEIGAVQQGFNQMTNALLTNRRHLNRLTQQATQQLNEAITDLETRNRELGFARDEAQIADRSKSEFLANMSHEIRTPINGIKGFISLLSQSKLDHTQQRYVDIVLKSTGDLTNIVNEILDFSKMESGKLQIVEEEFDLYEVIEQTRDILFINVLTKNIDLNLIIYSDTPRRVVGDKLRLKQILLNLIGNAIKFTDQGRVLIKVSLADSDFDQASIEITVEDTGIGISEQEQETLFQAFSQVESSATRHFTGTGLGLVISKNLATLMGGDIKMHSSPGEGSQFTLQLAFKYASKTDAEIPDERDIAKALIFGADNYCLMEARTLFDRAGVSTESSLVDNSEGVMPVKQCIQRNLAYIDLLVFDLRHLDINLANVLDGETTAAVRIILLHYDHVIELPSISQQVELISVINTSQTIARLLANEATLTSAKDDLEPRTESHSKCVLLVDDNQVNLKLATELIRLWGHEVTPVNHGSKALELFCSQNFDLIILDIQMPDIDGVSLLHMMRKHKPADQTPVVALTANVLNDEAGRLIELGFDYFLSKPIDEGKFRGLLGSNTHRQPAESESAGGLDKELDCSVDYARSLALSAGNESLLKQIFEILQRDIPDQQIQLTSALTQLDHDRLNAIAHKLHGVTCYASLPRLRHKVLGFQQRLARDSDAPPDQSVQELIDELDAIKQEVGRYLQHLDAAGVSS